MPALHRSVNRGQGLIALYAGKVDIAPAAHPLEDLVAGAAKEGVVIDQSRLVATGVEDNRLVVIANRKSEAGRLSKEELKGIFTGKIVNWKEVGGKELPVRVVWGKPDERVQALIDFYKTEYSFLSE